MTKEEVHHLIPSLKAASDLESPFKVPKEYFESIESQVEATIQLDNISRTKRYSIPDGYFDTVEDVVLAKLKATALNKDASSQDIPEGYFNNIEDKVLEKLKLEEKRPETKVISLQNWRKIVTPIAAAASIILLLTIGSKQEEVSFENLALSEIETAIESNFIDYNSETLLEIFPEVEASLDEFEIEISEEENLETYLYETDLSNLLYE